MRLSNENQYKRASLGGLGDFSDILNTATSSFTTLANTALGFEASRAALQNVENPPAPAAGSAPAAAAPSMMSSMTIPLVLGIGVLIAWKMFKKQ